MGSGVGALYSGSVGVSPAQDAGRAPVGFEGGAVEVTQPYEGRADEGFSWVSHSKMLRWNWPLTEVAGPPYWWPTAAPHPPNGSSMLRSSRALWWANFYSSVYEALTWTGVIASELTHNGTDESTTFSALPKTLTQES